MPISCYQMQIECVEQNFADPTAGRAGVNHTFCWSRSISATDAIPPFDWYYLIYVGLADSIANPFPVALLTELEIKTLFD